MKSGNKKHNVRIAALIAAVLALCLALTGCMMGSGKQPSINAEDDSTVAYADRQLRSPCLANVRHAFSFIYRMIPFVSHTVTAQFISLAHSYIILYF